MGTSLPRGPAGNHFAVFCGYRRSVTKRTPDVLVVGAGVAGLTTAICLAEQGLQVDIRTRDLPRDTTSAAAGAIWGPHLVEKSDRVTRWSRETLAILTELANDPGTGVRAVSGMEAYHAVQDAPEWAPVLGGVTPCYDTELPPGFTSGWRYTAPVVSMRVYLDYLLSRFRSSGGDMEIAALTSLEQAAQDSPAPVIVNCTGIGAHSVVPDSSLSPVRGQVVIAENPGIREFFIGLGDSCVYFFPHEDRLVLGGTEDRGNWSTQPDPQTASRILRACADLDSRLDSLRVLEHRVGLRPVRPLVRLEADGTTSASVAGSAQAGRLVMHNYGHGGSGVTLSWGCAREVTDVVLQALGTR
jgi:D-amino-acid oxidase